MASMERGERGPKGDHGQGGSQGESGLVGERGEKGAKGERGDTGQEGMPGRDTPPVLFKIHRSLRRLIVATVLLYGIVAVMVFLAWRTAVENKDALCSVRTDLEHRVAASTEFLEEHPNGVPGISAKVIRDGIADQTRTIDALQTLNCP